MKRAAGAKEAGTDAAAGVTGRLRVGLRWRRAREEAVDMTDGSGFKIIYVAGMISMFVISLAYRVRRGGSWGACCRA